MVQTETEHIMRLLININDLLAELTNRLYFDKVIIFSSLLT